MKDEKNKGKLKELDISKDKDIEKEIQREREEGETKIDRPREKEVKRETETDRQREKEKKEEERKNFLSGIMTSFLVTQKIKAYLRNMRSTIKKMKKNYTLALSIAFVNQKLSYRCQQHSGSK